MLPPALFMSTMARRRIGAVKVWPLNCASAPTITASFSMSAEASWRHQSAPTAWAYRICVLPEQPSEPPPVGLLPLDISSRNSRMCDQKDRAPVVCPRQAPIAPMDPPAMLPALENKAIDGYATSMPFTTQAIVKGSAVMLATATRDAADLTPFAYGLVYARPETCRDKREKCARMARAMAGAARFIREKPAEALEILRKRFDKLDPEVLNAAWQVVSKAHAQDT